MATKGTFLLADIGGYTSFLSDVGLKHGKEITEHLLNRLVRSIDRPWRVANVMGDCVFFYSPEPEPPRSTFDSLRSLYRAFRDAQLEVAEGSTCRCGACDRTEELSLKFVVHEGEYEVQDIGGRKELVGSDIVLATRLLKNSVPIREYVIVTQPAAAVAEVAGAEANGGRDDLETIGPVDYGYFDLGPVRRAYEAEREFYISGEEANVAFVTEIDAPAEEVWDALNDLSKRSVWQTSVREMDPIQGEPGGVGEVHSCLHDDGTKIVHATIAVDEEGMRKTERLWATQRVMKDLYVTMGAERVSETSSRAFMFATFQPRIPVISRLARPYFIHRMKKSLVRDNAGLKEFCETGKVAGREPVPASREGK